MNEKLKKILAFSFSFFVVLAMAMFWFSASMAAIPSKLTIQGRLDEGSSLADGNYAMVFNVYNVSSGGTALYTESHTASNKVEVNNGFFKTTLGDLTALTLDFDVPYWLGITIESDSEISPRVPLTSSSYAMKAGGLVMDENLNIDSGTLFVNISDNRVGVGTTTPSYTLDVDGIVNATQFYQAGSPFSGGASESYVDSTAYCLKQCSGQQPGTGFDGDTNSCIYGTACQTGCNEADGGITYQTASTTSEDVGCQQGTCVAGASATDVCADVNSVTEYYCSSGITASTLFDCADNCIDSTHAYVGCTSGACSGSINCSTECYNSTTTANGCSAASGCRTVGTDCTTQCASVCAERTGCTSGACSGSLNCSADETCTAGSGCNSTTCNATWTCSTPGDGGYNSGNTQYRCQASCDGAGNCDYATNCESAATCKKCVGNVWVNQTSAEDLFGQCAVSGCYTGNCNGSGNCYYYTSGQQNCGTCKYCNSSGVCTISSDNTSCGTNMFCGAGTCHTCTSITTGSHYVSSTDTGTLLTCNYTNRNVAGYCAWNCGRRGCSSPGSCTYGNSAYRLYSSRTTNNDGDITCSAKCNCN